MIIDAKIEFNDDLDPESVQETIFLYLEALDGFVGIEYDAPAAEPRADAISRQEVIRKIKEVCNPYGKPQIDFEVGKKMIEWFKAMPPIQPLDPKKEINADAIYTLKWCQEEIENVKRSNEREADKAVVDLDAMRLLNQNRGLDIAKVIIKGALDHMTASRQQN